MADSRGTGGGESAVELAAYRVVQEAVSNAVRHAPGAAIRVVVRADAEELTVSVWNEAPATFRDLVPESGYGVIGMRERVTLVDGRFRAGATPDGGVAGGDALLAPSVTRRLVEDFARTKPALPAMAPELTPRETDVLRLVARGQSNREIAEQLVLAEQTVKSHVSRILAKLELRDRAQAVVYAYEAGSSQPGPRR